MPLVTHFTELDVYKEALAAAMRIFELSRQRPKEELYSLTDQIRRSSRSVCGCIAEAWRKRRYPSHFVSKLTDADSEAAETENWLTFARHCGYLRQEDYEDLWKRYESITRGLVGMMTHADRWCGPSRLAGQQSAKPHARSAAADQ
jgi:four helix bundle protein